jgi:hypothetical protein
VRKLNRTEEFNFIELFQEAGDREQGGKSTSSNQITYSESKRGKRDRTVTSTQSHGAPFY